LRGGRPLVVDDADRAPLPAATWTLLRSLGIRALATSVLVKRGRLAWALVAAHSHPREWRPEQVSLMAEVAERTWEAVQRAQALTAVREAREQAEQHARTLDSTLSSVLDLVFRYTPDGRFDYANQALLDLWGVTREQAIGKSMAELGYAPETEQIMLRDLAQVVATRAPVEGETHYTSPVGVPG
jgi:PAS domain S-box-containing protein